MYISWKMEGKQKEDNQKGLISELDSLQRILILWFFSAHTLTHLLLRLACWNHTCLCSTRPQQNWSYAKVTSLECLRKTNVPLCNTNKSFQGNRRVGWKLEIVLVSSCKDWKKVHDNSHRDFGKWAAVKHWVSFRQRAFTHIPKVCYCKIASPHKGDTVPVYQPYELSRQNVLDDPLTKKESFQKYFTSLHAQWASQCGKREGGVGAWIHSRVKYLTHGLLNESGVYGYGKNAGWGVGCN